MAEINEFSDWTWPQKMQSYCCAQNYNLNDGDVSGDMVLVLYDVFEQKLCEFDRVDLASYKIAEHPLA